MEINTEVWEIFLTEKVSKSAVTYLQLHQLEAATSDILGTRIDDMRDMWLYRITLQHQYFGHYIDIHSKSAAFTRLFLF